MGLSDTRRGKAGQRRDTHGVLPPDVSSYPSNPPWILNAGDVKRRAKGHKLRDAS
jgi:hypothetical protein